MPFFIGHGNPPMPFLRFLWFPETEDLHTTGSQVQIHHLTVAPLGMVPCPHMPPECHWLVHGIQGSSITVCDWLNTTEKRLSSVVYTLCVLDSGITMTNRCKIHGWFMDGITATDWRVGNRLAYEFSSLLWIGHMVGRGVATLRSEECWKVFGVSICGHTNSLCFL